MDISIIIPNHSDLSISNCVNSIDENVEVVIVLNKPTAELKKLMEKYNKVNNIKIVEIPVANLSKALNAGIEAAKYDSILIMDSDCVFEVNTIKKLYLGLKYAPLAKGKVVFRRTGVVSSVIAKAREYHTSSFVNAYSPPLALSKSIKDKLGYYFHDQLNWSEDYEFDMRVRKEKIKITHIPSALVYHPPLSIINDLKSAFRYGVGYQIGESYKLFPKANLLSISNILHLYNVFSDVKSKYGIKVAAYMAIWNRSYFLGIMIQRYFDIYKKRTIRKGAQ